MSVQPFIQPGAPQLGRELRLPGAMVAPNVAGLWPLLSRPVLCEGERVGYQEGGTTIEGTVEQRLILRFPQSVSSVASTVNCPKALFDW